MSSLCVVLHRSDEMGEGSIGRAMGRGGMGRGGMGGCDLMDLFTVLIALFTGNESP